MRRLTTLLTTSALLLGGAALAPAAQADDLPTGAAAPDPRGDARGRGDVARERADLTFVRYDAPESPDGSLRIRVRFSELVRRDPRGGPQQRTYTRLRGPGDLVYFLTATNAPGSFRALSVTRTGEERVRRIRPEEVTVKRQFGRDGFIQIRVSTEWLPLRRSTLTSFGLYRDAQDSAESFLLDVSGTSTTVVVPPVEPSP